MADTVSIDSFEVKIMRFQPSADAHELPAGPRGYLRQHPTGHPPTDTPCSHQCFMNGPSYRPNKSPWRVVPTGNTSGE